MKTIITELKDRLALVDKGQLPYCDTDAEYVALYKDQEAQLVELVRAANDLRRELEKERASYEACLRFKNRRAA